MKKYTGIILGLLLVISWGNSALAQKINQPESKSSESDLKRINNFIKESFSERYKYKGPWKYVDLNRKREIETTISYEAKLTSFYDCNISFSSSMKVKSQKSDNSEKIFFSLKDIDLNKTTISNESFITEAKDIVKIHFMAKKNLIRKEGKFLSTFSGTNESNYSYFGGKTNQYSITLKSFASLEEIKKNIQSAIKMCQEK